MRNYRNYTDEDIIKFAAEVTSLAQLMKKLGIKAVGGNYANMKKNLQRLNLECEHWKGQGWNAGERLKDWKNYTRSSMVKKHIIIERSHQCEKCENSTWMGESIPLEIHHLDGNKTNNTPDNLQLLCCNCHALTPNWRNKDETRTPINKDSYKTDCPSCGKLKMKKSELCAKCDKEKRKDEAEYLPKKRAMNQCQCGNQKLESSFVCRSCYRIEPRNTKINWPSPENMAKLVFEKPTSIIAEELGVSDKAVSKFCIRNNIEKPGLGYWAKLKAGKVP